MKLIVGSVFTSGDKTPIWAELQARFLKRTTEDYAYVVSLNGPIEPALFPEATVISHNAEDKSREHIGVEQSYNHYSGLTALLNYFRTHTAENYLILDSDCFPVRKGWLEILLTKMSAVKYDPPVAAAIRAENLDVFPHPCVFFVRGHAIHEPWLDLRPGKTKTLTQVEIEDVGCSIPLKRCYPLMRSNVYNPHPLFAAIYHHLFYHHSCGSRDLMPRPVLQSYFDHYVQPGENRRLKETLFHELTADPDRFLRKLMGETKQML